MKQAVASRQSNLAYDLSLFEAKPKKAQPVMNVVKEPKYKKRDRMIAVRIVSTVAVVVTITCVMLYSRAQLTELTDRVGTYQTEYQNLMSERTRLNAEIEGKVSLRSVEENAKLMGLDKMQAYQVEYVVVDEEEDGVVPVASEQRPSVAQKLSLYIQSFLEYIRFW
ncbi:MAG: hypothetical protein HFG26_02250 [Provencibacterium sp.]|nr:hypothetical protein [Provencibacterium sp.]